MDKKKKIVIIVAVVVIIAAIITAIILIVNKSNKDKEYIDTVVTEIVTDDNGERVTDEQGEIVTQVVTEVVTNEEGETVTDEEGKPVTQVVTNRVVQNSDNNSNQNNNVNGSGNGGGNNGSNSGNNGTNSGGGSNSGGNSTSENVTYKSRKVTVDVVLPYYNKQETELTLSYKVDGDKNYTKLDPVKVKLDKSGKVESFDLGELKGNVTVTVSFSGITISENTIIINGQDSTGKIKPVTGIEIIDGEDD